MFGLSISDIVVLVIYFGLIIYIGVRSSLKIKNKEDYFLGGRKFGKLFSTFASFGQATSADGPAGVATTTFNNGASGIWSSLLMLFATPIFWITSPWLRRLRVLTMGDFYEERYGSRRMAATYAIVATVGMMGLLSVGYKAVTKTALAMTSKTDTELTINEKLEKDQAERMYALEARDFQYLSDGEQQELEQLRALKPSSLFSHISENTLIWTICFLVLVYTSLGGLEAAFYTDMLQGIFIILLSFILIPFAWSSINDIYGGSGAMQALHHLHERLPESLFEIFGSPLAIDFTWYYIVAAAVVSGATVVTQPNQLVTSGAAKDEDAARFGFVTGTFMKRVVTIMWGALGLAAILLYSGSLSNSDFVWGVATKDLLGNLNLGLVGLMLASMMAALMSTADCLMITVSGLVVNNLYRPLVGEKSQEHFIWAGRIAGGIYLIGAALITTQFDSILQILKFIWEFFVIFAAAFWLGLKWRRANKQGAWASILGTFSLFYLIPLLLPVFIPSLRTQESLLKRTEPDPITRSYTARTMDVEERNNLIDQWEDARQRGTDPGTRPDIISMGQEITKDYVLPKRSIFWSKGLKQDAQHQLYGSGYIYLELWLLDRTIFDLSKNSFALNETIRLSIRLIFPFLVLMIVSLMTKPTSSPILSAFYNKMRTPVSLLGHEADQRLLADNSCNDDILLFKHSSWEFYRWKKKDWYGFLLSWVVVLIILGILYLVVKLGG